MNNITVRKMSASDVDFLYKIETKCFTQPWSKRDFAIIPSLDYAHFFVLEYDNYIVGFAGIYVLDVAELMNIAVLPNFQRMHFASMLLEECIKEAKRQKAEKMLLEVRKSNKAAIALYKKFGFFNFGVRRNYYKAPVEDAIIMMKDFKNEYSFF